MGVKTKASLRYLLLRKYAKTFIFSIFYRVEVNGLEKLDYSQPCIFLPCHQNGLLDCLTLLSVIKKPITFYAKAGFFKGQLMTSFLTFLRIMPVYRGRESLKDVKRNEENFEKGVQLLLQNYPLCIMPEGGQYPEHRLHNLTKGAFRIAFYAQEKMPQQQAVYLYPVGLDYGEYDKLGYPFVLNIGNPINVLDYMDMYRENPAKAINMIKDDVFKELSKEILHVRSVEHYPVFYPATYLGMQNVLQSKLNSKWLTEGLKKRQIVENKLNQAVEESPEKIESLSQLIGKYLSFDPDFVLETLPIGRLSIAGAILFVLLFFPLFVYGFLLNLPVMTFYLRLLHPKLKGGRMVTTVKSVVYLLICPIIHLFIALVLGLICHSWLLTLLIFLTGMPVTAFTLKYFSRLRLLKAKLFPKKQLLQKEISRLMK